MKQVFKTAMMVMTAAVALSSCKKDSRETANENTGTSEMAARNGNLIMARNLVRKGTDSLEYNAGGTLTKVIYSPIKYVSYQKSGNKLTAMTYENNQLYSKEVYTLENGRATQSVFTSYQYNIGISKTWWYDYDIQGRLTEKYNKDNTAERIKYYWTDPANLYKIKYYSAANQLVGELLFQRNNGEDKLKLNDPRSRLDPYLKIFGVSCNLLTNATSMTYPQSPGSNFQESHLYTIDRLGYPTKLEIRDQPTWTLKETQTFHYNN